MTRKAEKNVKTVALEVDEVKQALMEQKDFLVPMVQQAMQSVLEMEMEECLQAGRYERCEERTGYRSGYYRRRLITRVGDSPPHALRRRFGFQSAAQVAGLEPFRRISVRLFPTPCSSARARQFGHRAH